jgi:Family of unknown function (DUF6236)
MSTRGLVVAPRFEWDGVFLKFPGNSGPDAADLRRYLLYWDRIDFPDNNLISIRSSPDIEFLVGAGIMTRTRVQFNSSPDIRLDFIRAQFEAFKRLNTQEPGQWSLGQATSSWYVPSEARDIETRAVEIELYKALPVPPEDVALADILEFRDRRRAELLAFRSAMDDLYSRIVNDRDIPRAKVAVLTRLEQSLVELEKVTAESWTPRLLSTVKAELRLQDLLPAAGLGLASSVALELPPVLGAIGGVVYACIKFDVRQLWTPRLPASLKDFAYVYSQRELR